MKERKIRLSPSRAPFYTLEVEGKQQQTQDGPEILRVTITTTVACHNGAARITVGPVGSIDFPRDRANTSKHQTGGVARSLVSDKAGKFNSSSR